MDYNSKHGLSHFTGRKIMVSLKLLYYVFNGYFPGFGSVQSEKWVFEIVNKKNLKRDLK